MSRINKLIPMIFLFVLCFVLGVWVAAEDKMIRHEDFVQHLFDRLELAKPGTVLSLNEKITALEELKFSPRNGYKPDVTLHFGELADTLVHVYGIQPKDNYNYDVSQAIQVLVNKNILKRTEQPENEVPFDLAIELIRNIPQSPSYSQKTILLPRYLKESPASRCE